MKSQSQMKIFFSFFQAILEHDDIAECAVIGMPDKLKGQIPIGLIVLKIGLHNNLIST